MQTPKYIKWDMDRVTAYIKLKFRTPGDFLVRYSSEQQRHVLSVKWKGFPEVVHSVIYERESNVSLTLADPFLSPLSHSLITVLSLIREAR